MVVPLRRTCAAVTSIALAVGALFAAGCGNDEGVQSYTVPKTNEAKTAAAEYRILGAAYPADAPVWYFKLTGSTEQVTQSETGFDQLAASVKVQGDPSAMPTFTLPAGWTKTGPRTVVKQGMAIKTDEVIKFGPPDAPQEVTVSYIPGTGPMGGIAANLKRWADQVGAEFDADEKTAEAKYTKPIAGANGLRADFRGPKNPSAAGGPMKRPR